MVHSAAFSPDGNRIVTASDVAVIIWDVATGAQIASLERGWRFYSSAAFSPDGSSVVFASSHTAAIWKRVSDLQILQGPKPIVVLQCGSEVSTAAFSPDGTRVVTASNNMTAHIWDAAMGKHLAALQHSVGKIANAGRVSVDDARVTTGTFSADGTRIATVLGWRVDSWTTNRVFFAGQAHIWNAATYGEIALLQPPGPDGELSIADIRSASFSPNGRYLATTPKPMGVTASPARL
jgi:WD40 repeat protein